MSLAILDLNDTGVDLFVDGELRLTSPGFAVMDHEHLLVGRAAADRTRLLTHWSNNRFWSQLSLQPLPNATRTIRHHGDIALAHLEQIWREAGADSEEAIMAVPGGYDRDQLGLLLGIVREAGIPLSGIVESSLAAVAGEPFAGTILYLDVQLHKVTLSRLAGGVTLRHLETITVADTGLHTLLDRWAQIVATQFIQTSRFDPMHEAASEQALYNALPKWLAAREARKSDSFTLDLDDGPRSVQVTTRQLSRACSELYPLIVQLVRSHANGKGPVPLCLSHRWRGFPGLAEALRLVAECELLELPHDAVPAGIAAHLDQIRSADQALTYVTSVTAREHVQRARPVPAARRIPTHILLDHHAFAIGSGIKVAREPTVDSIEDQADPHCTVYPEGKRVLLDNHSDEGTRVNGELVTERIELTGGDRIEIGATGLTLISAE